MFRTINNALCGRTRSIYENLSMQEVLTLLGGLNGNVKGNVSYYYRGWAGPIVGGGAVWYKKYKLDNVSLGKIVDIIKEISEKEDKERKYSTSIEHQMYSKRLNERHYLKIIHQQIIETAKDIFDGMHPGLLFGMRPGEKYLIDFMSNKNSSC